MSGTQESCTCERCVAACKHKPGWFLPGEAEKVAAHRGISVQELFDTTLGVDWWEGDEVTPTTYLLTPAITTMEPGTRYPYDPHGQCVFLTKNGRCAIHAVKPYECRVMLHGETERVHHTIPPQWEDHQDQVRRLEVGATTRRRRDKEGG